jgi:hypothetical protein
MGLGCASVKALDSFSPGLRFRIQGWQPLRRTGCDMGVLPTCGQCNRRSR